MTYQLPKIQHDGDEQDLLIYKRYETSSDKPYRFITLGGYHPGIEVCLGLESVKNVKDQLKLGVKFVFCRRKDDENGYMLVCSGELQNEGDKGEIASLSSLSPLSPPDPESLLTEKYWDGADSTSSTKNALQWRAFFVEFNSSY